MLSKLEEEEADRLRQEAAANDKDKNTTEKFEHCAFGDMDLMGLSEEELDTQCDELFKSAPIDFVPREGNQIDMAIDELIKSQSITIPILHIRERLYLIGHTRITCDFKNDNLICRVGGGFEKFIDYVPKNHRYFERSLVVHMIKSGESLEGVVDALFNGRKLKNLIKESNDNISEPNTPERRSVKRSLSSEQSKSAKSLKRSASRNRPRFSFRDVDPYSKTKSINIQKVKRPENGTNYAWDEKENQGNTGNRQRALSNENIGMRQGSPALKNRKRTSSDYQSRKDHILKQIKL